MAVAGVAAIVEEDVKKVVALRTLSQMGLSMRTIRVGYHYLAYLHLISHGFFKRLLFLQIGYLIHSISSQQDPRMFIVLGKNHLYLQVLMKTRLLTLSGQMFANGMVTKEAILNLYMSGSLSVLTAAVFVVRLIITFLYSYRLWLSLFKFGPSVTFIRQGRLLIKVVRVLLVITSVSYMWWLGANLVIFPSSFTHEGRLASVFLVLTASVLYGFIKGYKHRLLSSKFFRDYLLVNTRNAFMPVKFLELLHYRLNRKAFIGLKIVTLRFNLYIKGINMTTVFIIVMLVFL